VVLATVTDAVEAVCKAAVVLARGVIAAGFLLTGGFMAPREPRVARASWQEAGADRVEMVMLPIGDARS